MKNKCIDYLKKDPMLAVSVFAAIISLFITKPSAKLFKAIDWKTLATLFMLLSVLDGFKAENLFNPVLKFVSSFTTLSVIGMFLVFSVFFSSMFVTNDVSLIIFVPLTIILFRQSNREEFILPLLVTENIAAVRGSLLTPFGSPQNLFLFSKSGMDVYSFLKMMFPIWGASALMLVVFVLFIFRHNLKEKAQFDKYSFSKDWKPERKKQRFLYVSLFVVVVTCVVSRTSYWYCVVLFVTVMLLFFDRNVFKRVDYVLLVTFFCFFVFSSSITANQKVYTFLSKSVTHHEYIWALGLSQIISNVPASIVLWPFSENLKALIYGLDTAGLVLIIGSLASVINLRLYLREYPGRAKDFIVAFEAYGLSFFAFALVVQYFCL